MSKAKSDETEEALEGKISPLLKLIRKYGKNSEKVREYIAKNESVPGFDNLAKVILELSD